MDQLIPFNRFYGQYFYVLKVFFPKIYVASLTISIFYICWEFSSKLLEANHRNLFSSPGHLLYVKAKLGFNHLFFFRKNHVTRRSSVCLMIKPRKEKLIPFCFSSGSFSPFLMKCIVKMICRAFYNKLTIVKCI